jgi:hypothetical protein
MRYRMIKTNNQKGYTITCTCEMSTDLPIAIDTWKGTYMIDIRAPTVFPPKCELEKLGLQEYKWCALNPHPYVFYSFMSRNQYELISEQEFRFEDVYYHPILKTWTLDTPEKIFESICEWVIAQPPSPDFECAKEDKAEIEKTFSEFETSV